VSTPVRQCAGCGRRRPQRELVRIGLVAGELVIDRDRRLGGRGVYLCPDRRCTAQARRRGAIPRRLRCTVTVPPDLEDRVAIEQQDTSSAGSMRGKG
jgi:predicted RNA-binding protein YlxR (DUF448 family)